MGRIDDELLKRIRRFIEANGIRKAILFGSAARGDMGEDSDVDLILVDPRFEGQPAMERPVDIHMRWDLGVPVDFICLTESEFQELSGRISIVSAAIEEGVVIAG